MAKTLYRQQIPVAAQTLALGSTFNFAIPRESLIEGLQLFLEGTVGTVSTTVPVEGLAALVKSVSIRGSIGGGPAVEICNGVPGADLYEIAQFQKGSLPLVVGGLGATGAFRLNLPIWFREWFFTSEIKNLMTAIPAYAMSDLTLSVTIASQAEAGAALVLSGSPRIGVVVNQFYRDSIPQGLPFIRSTYEGFTDTAIATATDREIKLPSGGLYSILMARSYSAANTKQADTGTAPITANPAGSIRLYDLSRFTKAESNFLSLRQDNAEITLDTLVTGNAAFVFNRGESNLFQTGQLGRALNNVTLVYNSTAASGAQVRFVYRRILDDANALAIPV